MLRKAVKGEENPVANPELIRKMATNQLAEDIASLLPEGPEGFREWMPFEGLGMGLGVWVTQDSSRLAWNSNPGEFGWGGSRQHGFLDRSSFRFKRPFLHPGDAFQPAWAPGRPSPICGRNPPSLKF